MVAGEGIVDFNIGSWCKRVVLPSSDAMLLSVGVTGIDTSDNVTLIVHHNVAQLLFWMWQAFMTMIYSINTAGFSCLWLVRP